MKKTLLLSTTIFFLFFPSVSSQEQEEPSFLRNQIGFQLNPYIDQQFFDFRFLNNISGLRYGYRITKNVITGLEFSCNFPVYLVNATYKPRWFNYKVGLLTRYSILPDKRFQIFGEASPYYSHAHYSNMDVAGSNTDNFRFNDFGIYVAPGISLNSKSKKFGFDLYYKFSNLKFMNGNKSVLSYKVNYNF